MSSKTDTINKSKVINFYLSRYLEGGFNKIFSDIEATKKKQVNLILLYLLVILAAYAGYSGLTSDNSTLGYYFLTAIFALSTVILKLWSNSWSIRTKLNNFKVLEDNLNVIEHFLFNEMNCIKSKTLIGCSLDPNSSNESVFILSANEENKFYASIYNSKIIDKKPHLTEVILSESQQSSFFKCLEDSNLMTEINEVWS
ncbi:hypothetical protein ACOUR8_17705 [Acinetobacter baumannii]